MPSTNNYKVVLDFLLDVQADTAQAQRVADQLENIVGNISPEFDTSSIKDSIQELSAFLKNTEGSADALSSVLSGLDIEFNTDEAKQAFQDIEKMLGDLDNFDLDVFEKAFDSLDTDAIEQVLKKLQNEANDFDLNKLSQEFDKAAVESMRLLETQKKALAQIKLTGGEGGDEYNKLRQDIAESEAKVNEFKEALQSINDVDIQLPPIETNSFDDFVAKAQSIGEVGNKFTEIAEGAMEVNASLKTLQAQTGATGDELETLRGIAENAFINGIGENLSETINTVGKAKSVLGNFLNDEEIGKFVQSAGGIAKVFDKDINEVISGSRTLIAQYGLDGQKAAELVSYAMQKSGSKMDDTLDTLDEYSQLVIKAGFNAEEFVGVLTNGMQAGARDTDKLADAIKETQIRLNAGDTTTAIEAIKSPITAQITGVVQLAEQGKISIKDMMQQTTGMLKTAADSGQISAAVRDKFAVALSGTMAEDIGGELYTKIFSSPIDAAMINKKAKEANELMLKSIEPQSIVEKVTKSAEVAYQSAISGIAPYMKEVGSAMTNISQVAPGLTLMKDVFDSKLVTSIKNVGASLLGKVVPGLIAQTAATTAGVVATEAKAIASTEAAVAEGVQAVATEGATAAQWSFNAAALANPYILGAVAIAGAIAGLYALTEALHDTAAEQKQETDAHLKSLQEQEKLKKSNIDLAQSKIGLVEQFKKEGASAQKNNDLMLQLAQAYPGVISTTKSYAENLKALEQASSKTNGEISKTKDEIFKLQNQQLAAKKFSLELDAKITAEDIQASIDPWYVGVMETVARMEDTLANYNPVGLVANWISGGKTSSNLAGAVEGAVKDPMLSAINNAKNDTELQKASSDMQIALFNDPKYASLSDSERQEMLKKIQTIEQQRRTAMKATGQDVESITQQMMSTGHSHEEIVEHLSKRYKNLTKEQIEEMVKKTEKATEETKKAKDATSGLAEEWKKVNDAASKAVSDSITAYAANANKYSAIMKKDAASRTADEQQFVSSYKQTQAEVVKTGREGVKTRNELNKISAAAKNIIDPEIKAGKTLLEIAKEKADAASKDLQLKQLTYDVSHKQMLLETGREDNVYDELLAQREKVRLAQEEYDKNIEIYKSLGLIESINADGISYGEKFWNMNDKNLASTKNAIDETFNSLKGKLQDEQLKERGIKLKVNVDDEAYKKSLLDLKLKQYNFEVEMGIKAPDDISEILAIYDEIGASIAEKSKMNSDTIAKTNAKYVEDLAKAETEGQKQVIEGQYDAAMLALNQKAVELTNQDLENQTARRGVLKGLYDKQLADINERNDSELAQIQGQYDKIISETQNFVDRYNEVYSNVQTSRKDAALAELEDEQKEKQELLDKYKEAGLLSDKEYNAKKEAIDELYSSKKQEEEDKLAKKLELQKNLANAKTLKAEMDKNAAEAEAERNKNFDIMTFYMQRQIAGEQLTAEEQKAFEQARKDYDKSLKKQEKNTNDYTATMGRLGDSAGDAMTSLFAGDPEGIKDSGRAFLQTEAGFLQAQAEALITTTVMKWLEDLVKTSPYAWIAIAAEPMIKAAASGLVHTITDPVISSITSFATGSGPLTTPTLAVIGDAPAGIAERVLRDDQLRILTRQTVEMTNAANNATIAKYMTNLINSLGSQKLTTKIAGSDILVSQKRTKSTRTNRNRG